jgi:acetyl-CoA acetyltransferase
MSHIPAATREWALLNPMAIMHDKGPITVEDVMKARLIAWPFGLLDSCLVADGGGALVIVGAERARDFPKSPVWILGTGEAVAHRTITQMRDLTTSDAARISAAEAFRAAGVTPADIDHAMLYDAFSITPLLALEDLGFVKPGEAGPFVADSRRSADGKTVYKTGPGGDFPMNTNGGGLSYCHTGKYGMFAMLESVFQLRGDCGARQLKDVELSIAHGPGRQFAAAGTIIMSNR